MASQSPSFSFKVQGQEGVIPALGFGTATIRGDECVKATKEALAAGYRMLDTALLYANQEAVGQAVRESGLPREDIWITSKVAFFPEHAEGVWMHNPNNIKGSEAASIDLALEQLGVR